MSDVMFLHTPHEKSERVRHLQTLLQNHKFYHGAIDGEFGLHTYQAVYRAKYWFGYSKPDHLAGPVLVALLDGSRRSTARMRMYARLRQRSVKRGSQVGALTREARTHLGTRESPPNSNRVLFSTWYGLIGSWCAMFVSYCGVKAGRKKTFKRGFHYAYVPFVVADARAGRNGLTIVHPSQVQQDDLVCYDWPGESPGTADHIGIFDEWIEKGVSFYAIEGNTASGDQGSQSNGGGVFRRSRQVSYVQAFVRVHK